MMVSRCALVFVLNMVFTNSFRICSLFSFMAGGYMRSISSTGTVFLVVGLSASCSESELLGDIRPRKSRLELVVRSTAQLMPLVAFDLTPFHDAVFAVLVLALRTSSCHFRWTLCSLPSFSPSPGFCNGGGGGVHIMNLVGTSAGLIVPSCGLGNGIRYTTSRLGSRT